MSLKALKPLEPKSDVSTTVEALVTTENLPLLSQTDLLGILVAMQRQLEASQKAQAEANKALADAILETTKPRERLLTRKERAEEENAKQERIREKDAEVRLKATIKYSQDNCDHIAGCNEQSSMRDIAGRTSIGWHRLDIGAEVGVCTVCQRIFTPLDPEYRIWRKRPSFNQMSSSGNRNFADPIKALETSFLHDKE
jgi:hypothetical protein